MTYPRYPCLHLLIISTYPRGSDRGSYATNTLEVSSGRMTGNARDAKAISATLMVLPHKYGLPSERILSTNLPTQ